MKSIVLEQANLKLSDLFLVVLLHNLNVFMGYFNYIDDY